MIDIQGKTCIVTGATSGIGYHTALEIARTGATTIFVGRNETKCKATQEKIQQESGNPSVEYLVADLSSQEQIRAIARAFNARHDHLDVLVNNAGANFLLRKVSVDGIEMTFATNHLAYFLLTNLLLDALKASPSARVINVSSGSHYHERINFDDLQLCRFYNPVHAYGQSKLANILFTYELARRMEGTHVTSNALTPGMVATDIWKKIHPLVTPFSYTFVRLVGKTPQEGAQTSIYLATSPEVEGLTGKYFVDCKAVPSDPLTYDLSVAKKLWDVSAQMVRL